MYIHKAIIRYFFSALPAGESKSIPKDVGVECLASFRRIVVSILADSATARVGKMLVHVDCK